MIGRSEALLEELEQRRFRLHRLELRHLAVLGRALRPEQVAGAAAELGLTTVGAVASPLPGPSGNVEYFLWLRADDGPATADESASDLIDRAVREGPQ